MSRNSCTRASPGWPGWSVFVFLNVLPPDFLHEKTPDAFSHLTLLISMILFL